MSKKVGIYGGTEEFLNFLNILCGGSVMRFNTFEEAFSAAEQNAVSILFILPCYSRGEEVIQSFSEPLLQRLCALHQKEGFTLFIENYVAESNREFSVLGANVVEKQKYFCREYINIDKSFSKNVGAELVQARSGFYLPAKIEFGQSLINIVNCIGTHTPVGQMQTIGAGLVKVGNFYASYFTFTLYDGIFNLPRVHFKKLYAQVFSNLVYCSFEAAEKAFDTVYPPVIKTENIYKKRSQKERENALLESIENVLVWHTNSGIIYDLSGKSGVYEMFNSSNLALLRNKRVDVNFFTATLFIKAGKYFKNENYIETGKNIINYLYEDVKFQITEGENAGAIKWYDDNGGTGCTVTYVSDSCRCGLNIIELWRLTGDIRLFESAKLLGELILKWFGGQSVLAASRFDYAVTTVNEIQKEKNDYAAPEFHEAPAIFLKNLFDITGDERYKNQLKKTGDTFAAIYPDYTIGSALSKNFTYGRLLGLLSAAGSCTGEDYSSVIGDILNFFEKLTHPSGGIKEDKAYIPEGAGDKLLEFGTGFGEGYDSISDTLYCCNTLLAAFTILKNSENKNIDMEKVNTLCSGLTDFLLNIQIKSQDARLNGAWMRAFDMENEEYYGCHKDFCWGPYCLMGGWVMGAIPLIFLGMLGEGYIY